jgi:predicted nucleotidyltransferase
VLDRHSLETITRVHALLEDAGIGRDSVLAVVEAGSTAHAISVGSDDLDFTVVRVEPFHELVVGNPRRQSMMLRTKPGGARSEPGDIDLQVYTLRKFVNLAAAGNPSVLMILFAPKAYRLIDDEFPAGEIAELTKSRRAAAAYRGYMEKQIERWIGSRGQKNVKRPELEAAHGYDTKYAAHTIRLGVQGVEYLSTGALTLPMPEAVATRIRDVRGGVLSEGEALEWARQLEVELESAAQQSQLPDRPNPVAIERFLSEMYAERYGVNLPGGPDF